MGGIETSEKLVSAILFMLVIADVETIVEKFVHDAHLTEYEAEQFYASFVIVVSEPSKIPRRLQRPRRGCRKGDTVDIPAGVNQRDLQ